MFQWFTRLLGFGKGIKARYDAAQTSSQNTRHWANADALGAVTANSPAVRTTLRNRSRYEYANNSYYNGMTRTIAYHTIGTGPTIQVSNGGNEETEIARKVELEWRKSARSMGLASKLITARQSRTRDGEVFLMLTTNRNIPGKVKLDFQVIEADRIYSPLGMLPQANHVDGIDYDEWGNPERYWLHSHPGENGMLQEQPVPVSAQFMIHLFREDRPGQRRGIPEFTPALPLFAILRRYTMASVAAAETAANISVYLKTAALPDDMSAVEPWQSVALEQNTMMTLPDGYDIAQLKAEQPTSTHEVFTRSIVKEIARCGDIPYNVAAGDSSAYNYASGKLDYQNFDRSIEVDRDYTERAFLDRLFEEWSNEAALADVIPRIPLDSEITHEWRWPAPRSIDAKTDATANEISLRSGQLSLPTLYARQGQDASTEQKKMADSLGLSLDEYRALLSQQLFTNGNPLPSDKPQAQQGAANEQPAAA